MITITIILSILILFLIGILFIPLRIAVKTKTKEFYIKLPGYFRVDLIMKDEIVPVIKIRLFLFSFKIEPRKHNNKKTPQEKKIHKTERKIEKYLKFFIACLKQFRIKKLYANIDTGNFPLNAQLIPVVNSLNSESIYLNINFENHNQVDFITTTQIYRILYSLIKYSMFNK